MNNVENLEDHMAFSCKCGCVRFNLLKSGGIECDDCGEKIDSTWGMAQPAVAEQHKQKYTTTRNAWTGKANYKCNTCGRDDFRSEHAAAFHECGEKAQPAVASEQSTPCGEPVAHTAVFHCPNCEYPHRQVTHITGLAQPPWLPQRSEASKPLTDEQCKTLWAFEWKGERVQFIRAIEAAHGITSKD